MAARQNKVLSPGGERHYNAEQAEWVLGRTDRLWVVAARWARAVMSSPQARMFTDAEVALVEVGAHVLDRWRFDGAERRSSELSEFGRINERLLGTHAARLRAHVELAPAAEPDLDADELAARRVVRERLA